MLDCQIWGTDKQPEHRTPVPAASRARVEVQTTVDQPDSSVDVLAVPSEDKGSRADDFGIVRGDLKRPPS